MNRHNKFYNPYSFVPLNNEILTFSKEETEKYEFAHDIPITKNSISGQIEVEMRAETPFCIKTNNEHSVNIDRKYFIPGTTIKGMFRNVFEIITLSNIKRMIADSRYSMRDLRSNDYKLKNNINDRKGGFLIKLNNKHYIVDSYYDNYSYEEIKDSEGVDIKNIKTISAKYRSLKEGHIFQDEGYHMWLFSGYMHNKKHEFLFDIPHDLTKNKYPIEDNEWKDFIFIHEKENENDSWKFWKRKLKNYSSIEEIIKDKYEGIVPCFYRLKKENNKTIVKDLGFSFLYRQPYNKTIHNFLPRTYHNEELDMTELVFGYNRDNNNNLKGRVSFSNAFINNIKIGEKQTFIMGKPKPTFYPFYLKQDKNGRLKTYFTNDAILSGWKRNLVHNEAIKGRSKGYSNVESSFIPIKAGATVKTTIKFHNLSKPELGALLSAITYHDYKEGYHLLGYAKAFGYGKFKILDTILKTQSYNKTTNNIKSYINDFENLLKEKSINLTNWQNTLDKLRLLASGQYSETREIKYPSLSTFKQIKNQKLSLRDYSPK